MLYAHGTTLSNAISIINSFRNGEEITEKSYSIWDCSCHDEYFYLWPADYADDEDIETMLMECAIDSAIAQTPVKGENKIVVLFFDIPENEVEIDKSCQGMENKAARIPLDRLKDKYLVKAFYSYFNKHLLPIITTYLFNLENEVFTDFYIENDLQEAALVITEAAQTKNLKDVTSDVYQNTIDMVKESLVEYTLEEILLSDENRLTWVQ